MEEVGMKEVEKREAVMVEAVKEKLYPPPLHTHDEVINDKPLFMDSLRHFHSSMGTKFTTPVLGGKEIDLHLLYKEVTQRDGLEKVISEKKWRKVIAAFNFPPTTTSASFVLRKNYLSLLHHYEQVYFFRAQGPPIPPAASSMTKTPVKLQRTPVASDSTMKKPGRRKREHPQPQSNESSTFTLSGSIDGKFEHGYLVTVKIGRQTLHGVLFHVEQPGEASSSSPILPPANTAAANGAQTQAKRRKKRRWRHSDPAHPKPNRSAYNFFFSEEHSKLRALYPQREREFSKMIGEAWSKLTEEERKVYQVRGDEDKKRYKREMIEYREKQKLTQSKEVAGAEPSSMRTDEPAE